MVYQNYGCRVTSSSREVYFSKRRVSMMRCIAVISALVCLLSSCVFGGKAGSGAGSSSPASLEPHAIDAPMPEIPEGLGAYYRQGVTWKDCSGDGLRCGAYTVPLDYSNPSESVIRIAAVKRPADGERIGTLLVNPGGPGGSGQDLARVAKGYFPRPILEHFDIVGFDPRGVNDSSPIDCLEDNELSKLVEASYPDTPEGRKASRADAETFAAGCEKKSGNLLSFVGTENAARDMDVIRHVEGDPKLYYVGFSYGTELGAEYAELFPKNVGRMVLDGAMASTRTNFEQAKEQLVGFEQALNTYLDDCIAHTKNCPFSGTLDEARATVSGFFEKALREPLKTSKPDEPLTESGLLYGIITPLYTSDYKTLTKAFNDLINKNDASLFQTLFDNYLDRSDGVFANNSFEANVAITCADYPAEGTEDDWIQQAKELSEAAPVFGPVFGYDDTMCSRWPYQPDHRVGNFKASGSDLIVVVGTKGDPATPYSWAEDLSSSLENATLITWEGEGHTAYGRSTDCVSDPINAYLLNGSAPEKNLICPAQ